MSGMTIWFTDLSGSGKSTLANAIIEDPRLKGLGRATLLDGDVVRTHLSKGLGFSREDRDTNVARLGWVCKLITDHDGIAIVAAISPYREARDRNRVLLSPNYMEVFVDCPLEVCERRDVKGLYARARRGEVKGFTGIDDPYESPLNPEVHVNTAIMSIDECIGLIFRGLPKD